MKHWCIQCVYENGFYRIWSKTLKEARSYLYNHSNLFNDFYHIEIVSFAFNRVVSKYNCYPCSMIKVDLSLENSKTIMDNLN